MGKTQEEMWSEFNNHFSNPNRDKGGNINHHDFLDAGFIKNKKDFSRKSFFQKMGNQSV
jgi:hypothetical protein